MILWDEEATGRRDPLAKSLAASEEFDGAAPPDRDLHIMARLAAIQALARRQARRAALLGTLRRAHRCLCVAALVLVVLNMIWLIWRAWSH